MKEIVKKAKANGQKTNGLGDFKKLVAAQAK